MKESIVFKRGDFLNNAGLVGFYQVLQYLDKEQKFYTINDDSIIVDREFFIKSDFTNATFDVYINKFGNAMTFNFILNLIDNLVISVEDINQKTLNQKLSNLKSFFESKSLKNCYDNLKKELKTEYNLYNELSIMKDITDRQELKQALIKLNQHLNIDLVNKRFLLTQIMYSIVNQFIDKRSILDPQKAKKDIYLMHFNDFELPLKNYLLNEKKREKICKNCGGLMSYNEHYSETFIKDQEDCNRKKNTFWNFSTKMICPKCLFLYSFIPLGFNYLSKQLIFINNSSSIKNLIDSNIFDFNVTSDAEKHFSLYKKLADDVNSEKVGLVQIVINNMDNKYNLYFLDKQKLNYISNNYDYILNIAQHPFFAESNNQDIIYLSVMQNILKNTSQLNLIKLLNENLIANKYLNYYIYQLLEMH